MSIMGTQLLRKPSDRETYLRLLRYLKPYKNRFLGAIAVSVPASSLNGAMAWIVGPLFDQLVKSQNYALLTYLPLLLFTALILQAVFEYLSDYLSLHVATSISRDLRRDLFKSLSRMDVGFIKSHTTGELIARYYRDPTMLEQAITTNLQGLVIQCFTLVFLAGVLLYRNWWLALISLAIMSLIVIPLHFISKKVRQLDYKLRDISSLVMNRFQESIMGSKVIHGFNLEAFQRKRFDKASTEYYSSAVSIQKTSLILKPIMQCIAGVGIAGILFIGSLRVQSGQMTPGDLVSFIVALVLLYKPVKVLGGIFGKIQRILAPAERVFDVMDRTSAIVERQNAVSIEHFETLTLDNVSFGYEPGKPVLKDINLTIERGETVALVGPSGGGKSTLVDLLPRFMDPTEGKIHLNGVDLRDVKLHSLRNQIAIVTQDTILFEGSIRENVRLGRLDATEADVEDAVRCAQLMDWVDTLDEGLETQIGERGNRLSGGQRQRIAIARAFLKNAPILILDEATSALDNESEYKVQVALTELMRGKTVIVIAHRLSTVKHANRILAIANGRILEEGSHDDLLARQGLYYRFHMLQFREEDDTPAPALKSLV